MGVYKRGKVWWYKFTFNTESIRESSKQTNKRVAEQMEAAHKTALAKGQVGVREHTPITALHEFAENDFLPFIRSTFAARVKTRTYYESGLKSLLAYGNLASLRLDAITSETMAGFAAKRREQGLEVSSINRELQVLRRMFSLAQEWRKVEKVLPKVRMLPGESHRERVLAMAEEKAYLKGAGVGYDGECTGAPTRCSYGSARLRPEAGRVLPPSLVERA
jgi:hypothetical protein